MKRLLIADDDAGIRVALEARFQRRGWLVDVPVRAASIGGRSGGANRAHPALLQPRKLSHTALARALSSQSSSAFSPGNFSHGFRAVARDGSMRTSMALGASRWSLDDGRSVRWMRSDA